MKVLAVDTSTKNCSICILDNENVRVEISLDIGQTHSKHLMKMIQDGLDQTGCTLSDIDGYAVVLGPGSFTGLRIGLSTIKGLAFASQKPVVGISSMDALAFQCCPTPYRVCVILDARKKEVYSCSYQNTMGIPQKIHDETVGSIAGAIEGIDKTCLYVGDGAVLYQKKIIEKLGEKALFPVKHENRIRASSVAYLGFLKLKKNESGCFEDLSPHYIRPPDAKIKKNMFM